ncbi:hypothetical protein F4782DRAFT_521496 [Xylaria castorea]|nr:hypothetical protein F4782DRAFT_521496 [Xylaria castorea]
MTLDSQTREGIDVILVTLPSVPTASLAAWALAKRDKLKPILIRGSTLFNIGLGLFVRLDEYTPIGEWAGYMFVGPISRGLLLSIQLSARIRGRSSPRYRLVELHSYVGWYPGRCNTCGCLYYSY